MLDTTRGSTRASRRGSHRRADRVQGLLESRPVRERDENKACERAISGGEFGMAHEANGRRLALLGTALGSA